jgi:hypothetical protein
MEEGVGRKEVSQSRRRESSTLILGAGMANG